MFSFASSWARRSLVALHMCAVRRLDITKLFFLAAGKSSLLACIGEREVPVPDHMDIFTLSSEIDASDKTALECVMEASHACFA